MPIRKATTSDVRAIHKLINSHAERQVMIPRSLNELFENLRDHIVYEEAGTIIGTCSLHVVWEDLAEVRSLAVDESKSRKGIGRTLVMAAIEEARALGIKRVFALTYVHEFFKKLGFREIEKSQLPHKIWGDCLHCHKFPDCDETAVIMDW